MSRQNTEKQNTHYANLRRKYRDNKLDNIKTDSLYIYGYHTVRAAINNKKRVIYELLLTQNGYKKIEDLIHEKNLTYKIVTVSQLNKLLGQDAIHQGIVAQVKALNFGKLRDYADSKLIILLDQITDPHNVGAIMRSCVALKVDLLITTQRHSPNENSIIAKTASGALDLINFTTVRNLSDCLTELQNLDFTIMGLDSGGTEDLHEVYKNCTYKKLALVLGSEGKGLREKTKLHVNKLVRLDMPGVIKALNVSNAAAIALYLTHKMVTH